MVEALARLADGDGARWAHKLLVQTYPTAACSEAETKVLLSLAASAGMPRLALDVMSTFDRAAADGRGKAAAVDTDANVRAGMALSLFDAFADIRDYPLLGPCLDVAASAAAEADAPATGTTTTTTATVAATATTTITTTSAKGHNETGKDPLPYQDAVASATDQACERMACSLLRRQPAALVPVPVPISTTAWCPAGRLVLAVRRQQRPKQGHWIAITLQRRLISARGVSRQQLVMDTLGTESIPVQGQQQLEDECEYAVSGDLNSFAAGLAHQTTLPAGARLRHSSYRWH